MAGWPCEICMIISLLWPYCSETQYPYYCMYVCMQDKWIGGYRQGGVDVRGFSKLKEILDPDFKLILEQDMPFLIRETVRKHQWTVAHVTVWMRR